MNNKKSSGGFLKALGIIFLVILIIGGVVFFGKCVYKKYIDNDSNSDGNPVLLNRAATTNDIQLEQSIEATLTNLKDSYIITPDVDINGLKLTFKFYDSSDNIVSTETKEIGNVAKSNDYTVSISHSLSDMLKIKKYQYYVSGGTVSYFA